MELKAGDFLPLQVGFTNCRRFGDLGFSNGRGPGGEGLEGRGLSWDKAGEDPLGLGLELFGPVGLAKVRKFLPSRPVGVGKFVTSESVELINDRFRPDTGQREKGQDDKDGETAGLVHGDSFSVLVYPTVIDETIARTTFYRTGRGDRSIPLFLALLLLLCAPLFVVVAGPFAWPWGWGAALSSAVGAMASLVRWWRARRVVVWLEADRALEVRSGRRRRLVPWDSFTKIDSRPSAVRTLLWCGRTPIRLSHRLVRVDELLERLRQRRPDLSPPFSDRLVFRRSLVVAGFQTGFALTTAVAGALMTPWQPWLGGLFAGASLYILLRILFFVPRAYVVTPGHLTTLYWLRRRSWGRPYTVREDGYAAGGAVFFRMVLDYGRWKVALDEGHLRSPLRPLAGHVVHLLLGLRET